MTRDMVLACTCSAYSKAQVEAWMSRFTVLSREGSAALVDEAMVRWFTPESLARNAHGVEMMRAGFLDMLDIVLMDGAANNGVRRSGAMGSQSSRYTRRAVPLSKAVFSSTDAPEAMRLNAFHSVAQPIPIFSTGKLLSNMQRFGPNSSMQVSM